VAGALPQGLPPNPDGSLPPGITPSPETPFSAYVHVPYCRVRCGYCDFNTYTSDELRGSRRESYVEVVSREIDVAERVMSTAGVRRPLDTVFFGGGTPTLLPARDLVAVRSRLDEVWGITPEADVTTEANPDSVDAEYLDALVAGGFTRVSFGVQSVVPHVLATLDRTHDPERVGPVIEQARSAGLDVSVDLIYGTPGESLADWRRSLESAVDWGVDHVSAYALIIEDGTALERRIRRGEIAPIDDDLHADMYEMADEVFSAAGLSWYEISNWARTPQHQSRHNLAYWRNHDWWGFGPGAHSHVAGARWWNVKHPAEYERLLGANLSPAVGYEVPTPAERELERLMLGLRVSDGVAAEDADAEEVADLVTAGLLNDEAARSGQLVLTRAGRLRADEVVRRLAPEG
jgi:oxygen-independent coproporphyrinogen-3 oxidase